MSEAARRAARHVIWDFDGTLVDTYPAITAQVVAALRELGVEEDARHVRELLNASMAETLAFLSSRHRLDPRAVQDAYHATYDEAGHAASPAFPGARPVLEAVRARGGLNLVVTHRSRASVLSLLDSTGLLPLMDDMLSVQEGFVRKPSPEMFEHVMARHALMAPEVVVVGDRLLDVRAGRAAGCLTVLFGSTEPGEADRAAPDFAALGSCLRDLASNT